MRSKDNMLMEVFRFVCVFSWFVAMPISALFTVWFESTILLKTTITFGILGWWIKEIIK